MHVVVIVYQDAFLMGGGVYHLNPGEELPHDKR